MNIIFSVEDSMFRVRLKYVEIIRIIIKRVKVYMMNYFCRKKITTNISFSNQSMFKNISHRISKRMCWIKNRNSISTFNFSTFPVSIFFSILIFSFRRNSLTFLALPIAFIRAIFSLILSIWTYIKYYTTYFTSSFFFTFIPRDISFFEMIRRSFTLFRFPIAFMRTKYSYFFSTFRDFKLFLANFAFNIHSIYINKRRIKCQVEF